MAAPTSDLVGAISQYGRLRRAPSPHCNSRTASLPWQQAPSQVLAGQGRFALAGSSWSDLVLRRGQQGGPAFPAQARRRPRRPIDLPEEIHPGSREIFSD